MVIIVGLGSDSRYAARWMYALHQFIGMRRLYLSNIKKHCFLRGVWYIRGMSAKVPTPPLRHLLGDMKNFFGNHIKIGNTIVSKGKKLDPMGYSTLNSKKRGSLDSAGGPGKVASPTLDHSGPSAGPLSHASSGAPAANLRSPKKNGGGY